MPQAEKQIIDVPEVSRPGLPAPWTVGQNHDVPVHQIAKEPSDRSSPSEAEKMSGKTTFQDAEQQRAEEQSVEVPVPQSLDTEAPHATVPQTRERIAFARAVPAPRHETPLARAVRLEVERVRIEKAVRYRSARNRQQSPCAN